LLDSLLQEIDLNYLAFRAVEEYDQGNQRNKPRWRRDG